MVITYACSLLLAFYVVRVGGHCLLGAGVFFFWGLVESVLPMSSHPCFAKFHLEASAHTASDRGPVPRPVPVQLSKSN